MRFFILLFFVFQTLSAQKLVKKSLIHAEITSINVDAKNCYKLSMETTNGSEMVLEATIDGEYKKDLVLTAKREGSTVQVNSDFQPAFKNPSDKLSAHKVISIALKVYLPENKSVTIYGRDCNVTVSGNYLKLKITLNDGKCILKNVSESVTANTQSGDISVYTSGADVKASSKYGIVQSDKILRNDDQYDLTSVTGNITILKTD